MKKILVNIITVGKEGISIPWLLKFKEIQKYGYEIYFYCPDRVLPAGKLKDVYQFNKQFCNSNNFKSLKLSKTDFIFFSLWRNLIALKNFRNTSKYDIFYSPSSVLDLVILPFMTKKLNKKIKWVTVLDNIVPFTDPGNKIIRFLAWLFFQISILLIKSADHIFVISEDLKEYLIKRGFREEKITVTGNGIETDLIKRAKADTKNQFDALYVGRINETKGIYDMLYVLSEVKKKYPKFKLGIMGEGDPVTKKQFKEKIEKMGLAGSIAFLGFISGQEKYNIVKSCKTFWFLSKSKSESFGVALLEAVCLGKPAFVYSLEPFKKIYKKNEVIMSDIGDWKSVAEKVLKTFEKRNFENIAGIKLLNQFSWSKIAKIEAREIGNCFEIAWA